MTEWEHGHIFVKDDGTVIVESDLSSLVVILTGAGAGLPAWWTVDSTPGTESVGFAGAVNIDSSDTAQPPFTIDLPEDHASRAMLVRDFNGNELFSLAADGSLSIQNAAGSNSFSLDVGGGVFMAASLAGQSVAFSTTAGITVHPSDSGSDALDLNGSNLVPGDGAAMIVMRNPCGDPPDGFYSPDMLTINADLTAGAAKLLLKALDTNGDPVTAEIPLT